MPGWAGARLPRRAVCCGALLGLGLGVPACGPSRGTIGALLAQDGDRRLFIREVPPGLAADRAGVQEGDEVLLIDGRDARQMSPEAIHGALAGDVGQPVKLTLVRDDQVVRARLERTEPGRLRKTLEKPAP